MLLFSPWQIYYHHIELSDGNLRFSNQNLVEIRVETFHHITGGSSRPVGGSKFWPRGPNLLPFSTFSADLGHFILKLLNFDIYFIFNVYFLYLFRRFGWGPKALHAFGEDHGPKCPLDSPVHHISRHTISLFALWDAKIITPVPALPIPAAVTSRSDPVPSCPVNTSCLDAPPRPDSQLFSRWSVLESCSSQRYSLLLGGHTVLTPGQALSLARVAANPITRRSHRILTSAFGPNTLSPASLLKTENTLRRRQLQVHDPKISRRSLADPTRGLERRWGT